MSVMSSSPDKPSGPPPLTEPEPAAGPPPLPPADVMEPVAQSEFMATNRVRVLLGAVIGVFALLGIGMALFVGIMLMRMAWPTHEVAAGTGEQSTAAEDAADDQGTTKPSTETREGTPGAEASRKKGPPPDIQTAPNPPADKKPRGDEPDLPAEGDGMPDTEASVTGDRPDEQPTEPSADSPTEPKPPQPKREDPFEDIKKRNRVLPLPEAAEGVAGESEPKELAKLYAGSPDDCQLSILGSERLLGRGRVFEISRNDGDDTPTWTVVNKTKDVPATPVVGSFTLKDDSLAFQWHPTESPEGKAGRLRYCLLEIRVGKEDERCILVEPKEVDSVKADVLGSAQVGLPLETDWLSNPDLLRLDLQLHGFPKHEIHNNAGLTAGDNAVIRMLLSEDEKSFLEVEVGFDLQKQKQALLLEAFAMVPSLSGPLRRQEVTGDWLKKGSLEWNAERVDKLDADLDKTRKSIRENQQELDELSDRVAQLKLDRERLRGVNPAKEAQLAAEISRDQQTRSAVQQDLQKLKAEESSTQRSRDEADEMHRMFQELSRLFADLKARGSIDYQVYVEVEDEKVALIQSKGYPRVKSS